VSENQKRYFLAGGGRLLDLKRVNINRKDSFLPCKVLALFQQVTKYLVMGSVHEMLALVDRNLCFTLCSSTTMIPSAG
jgi:hypothetical protein